MVGNIDANKNRGETHLYPFGFSDQTLGSLKLFIIRKYLHKDLFIYKSVYELWWTRTFSMEVDRLGIPELLESITFSSESSKFLRNLFMTYFFQKNATFLSTTQA